MRLGPRRNWPKINSKLLLQRLQILPHQRRCRNIKRRLMRRHEPRNDRGMILVKPGDVVHHHGVRGRLRRGHARPREQLDMIHDRSSHHCRRAARQHGGQRRQHWLQR